MNSIDDPNNTAKKTAAPTEAEPTGKPSAEPDLLADAERLGRDLEPDLKRAEEAAHERAMMASLHRAASAAKLLTEARGEESPEDERAEPHGEDEATDTEEDDEEPRPAGIAFLSDGRTALHVSHLGGAELKGRETWTGVILHFAEACDVLTRLGDAADEAAGVVAGGILFGFTRREDEDDNGGAAQ